MGDSHPKDVAESLADESGTVGICQPLEGLSKFYRQGNHHGRHDGTSNAAHEGVCDAVEKSGPFLQLRPAERIVGICGRRLRDKENVLVAVFDILKLGRPTASVVSLTIFYEMLCPGSPLIPCVCGRQIDVIHADDDDDAEQTAF